MTAAIIPFDRLPKAMQPKVEAHCAFCKTSESKAKKFFSGLENLNGNARHICGECAVRFKTLMDEVDSAGSKDTAGEAE
jgi:hypothetical protein